MTKSLPPVFDPCCGAKKFYFAKDAPIVLYGDIRDKSYVQSDGRVLNVNPDLQLDVTDLPFEDETFALVVFDPPHLVSAGADSFMAQSYGTLPPNPLRFIYQGFSECWRVLKGNGTLIFKWNTDQIEIEDVLRALPVPPLFGNRRPTNKKGGGQTYWMVFFKAERADFELTA